MSIVGCGGGGGSGGTTPPVSPDVPSTDSVPSFGSNTIAGKTYTRDVAIEDETLPAATGGDGTLTYSLSPAPPTGLSFDAETRVLSGTPTTTQEATTYTYQVTDSDDTDPDSATLTFTITVNEPEAATVSIAASASSVNEWEDQSGVILTLSLNAPVGSDTKVELRSSGAANLAEDFDLVTDIDDSLEPVVTADRVVELTIEAGETKVSVTLRPIRDLEEEGDETATVVIAAVDGDTPSDDSENSVDIKIIDTGRPEPGEGVLGEFALLFGELSVTTTAVAIEIEARLFNEGTVASSATTGYIEARTLPEESTGAVRATPDQVEIGMFDANGGSMGRQVLDTSEQSLILPKLCFGIRRQPGRGGTGRNGSSANICRLPCRCQRSCADYLYRIRKER